jgi:AcrR family transcriptional regulator
VVQTQASTAERILDEAERLFAQRGVAGVSLREIALAASQRNNGAVQYHFGDKDGLVRAVFARRAAPIDRRRVELLAAVSPPRPPTVAGVVAAYVEPLADQVVAGNWYVPFLSRLQAEHRRDELLQPASAGIDLGFTTARSLLRTGPLSHLGRRTFSVRWRLTMNLAIDALADHQLGSYREDTRAFCAELVQAITGLLGGPVQS